MKIKYQKTRSTTTRNKRRSTTTRNKSTTTRNKRRRCSKSYGSKNGRTRK